jgi:hypothetical protein
LISRKQTKGKRGRNIILFRVSSPAMMEREKFVLLVLLLAQLCEASLDWAACFPKGREAADTFATKNGLRVVSEIIPESNCYQLGHLPEVLAASGRTKRQAEDAARRVIEDSDEIEWSEEQVRNPLGGYYGMAVFTDVVLYFAFLFSLGSIDPR